MINFQTALKAAQHAVRDQDPLDTRTLEIIVEAVLKAQEDFRAGLIHQPIPDMAGTEPRLRQALERISSMDLRFARAVDMKQIALEAISRTHSESCHVGRDAECDCGALAEHEKPALKALVTEFVRYWTTDRTPDGCGMCGGIPHSTTCYVGRMAALIDREAVSSQAERSQMSEEKERMRVPINPRVNPPLTNATTTEPRTTKAEIEDAIRQISRLMAGGWQPIASAPKDHSRFLAFIPGSRLPVQEIQWLQSYEEDVVGYWSTPYGPAGRGYTILIDAPTHWMPLPPAPQETP